MVGRTSLAAVFASALLLSGGGLAYADTDFPDADASLIEVHVGSESDIDALIDDGFDLAEYKRVESANDIVVAIDAVPAEIGQLKQRGFKIGRTIETPEHREAIAAARDAQRELDSRTAEYAENGVPKTRSAVAQPGETVIQRANKFTNYAGTFLYVEAHNKAIQRVAGSNTQFTGPTLQMAYAGADGNFVPADTAMPRFIDTDTTPDEYLYNRQLIRLTGAAANIPASQMTVRVAASTGSVDTFKVTEWLGSSLPPHVAGYQQGFFTRYQDPTENRAQLDKLAAEFPNLVTAVNLPNLTNGYQRKSQAILSGTSGIGVAPPAVYGAPIAESTGEITAAAPVASIPFNGTAGQRIFATVDGIPGGSTDFIFTLKSPTGAVISGPIDTGTSPEFITNLNLPVTGTYTFEVSGYDGDLGDFTFKVQPVQVSSAEAANGAVVLTSKDWGHQGGDQITAEVKAAATANAPLSVAVTGKDIVVTLATNESGAAVSTAKQVVDAINASPAATALVSATTYRNNAGAGIVQPRAKVNLDDFLNAPAHVARGPFQQRVYRIGSVRDGSKVGVFLYCQQHAREWTTGLSCVETAERLVKNYATDPDTKKLLDQVEVFVLPNVNPDGGHYSMYDYASQRRNMTNHCADSLGVSDPAARNAWGVDLNRNNGEYSLFDGYAGASPSCTSDVYAGPGEYSEPEIKNEKWVADTFPNIKFANNIHSFGGYFMWAPGSYKDDGMRTTAPAPNIGIEKYFFEAGEKILTRIKEYRNTVILPERTGPIADVLYSAAGNSADDQWYRKGIISYSFETGADRFISTTSGTAQIPTGFQPCFAGPGTYGGSNTQFGYPICDDYPVLLNEGRDQAMEFASGNFGMVESAYDYAMDTTPPKTSVEVSAEKGTFPVNFKFNWDDEAAVIHYTTDGSTPTLSSPTYNAQRARGLGEVLQLTKLGENLIKWIAVDIKGNQSAVQTKRVLVGATEETGTVGGTVPATLSLTLGAPATFPTFTPGVAREYTATTDATVTSTAGDATLSVADPSTTNTGKLVNGAFALAQPLQGLGVIKTWTGPTSNEKVTVTFKQAIGANDPLRTGTYSKTLTYTLSTTNP
ncbi:chitobiase/beta-hexosaminidase-like protein [Solirubrobacter pauli]|uniref:Chitobiase/beta-hexosaminidase-like protein n=1 Tax=Solirubrobacter pauli TaxID=166793 RepID=A0A660LH27_9ACTN|nr:M14 family metallopeptidase [Solirubrobacter pauli]RKQ93515.1 chitobiase/beta-hexosaminidase-like protein [Solirubrobacter pauli]